MMKQNLRHNVLKLNEPRKHGIKKSLTMKSIYRWVVKNKINGLSGSNTSYTQFSKIVLDVVLYNIDKLLKGSDFKLPLRMGCISIFKKKNSILNKDGSIKKNPSIDWGATIKYWEQDEQAYKDNILIRKDSPYVYWFDYDKRNARYKNKYFYSFHPNKLLRSKLGHLIINNKFDTFIK